MRLMLGSNDRPPGHASCKVFEEGVSMLQKFQWAPEPFSCSSAHLCTPSFDSCTLLVICRAASGMKCRLTLPKLRLPSPPLINCCCLHNDCTTNNRELLPWSNQIDQPLRYRSCLVAN